MSPCYSLTMGVVWRNQENPERPLKRETRLPPMTNTRRPFVLVGLLVVMVFFAASVDAFLWQQSAQREALRTEAAVMQSHANRLQMELQQTRAENRSLRAELEQLLLIGPTEVAPKQHKPLNPCPK